MTEPESMTQTRGKSGKAKAVFKRSKSESPSETASQEPRDEMSSGQNPQIIARIRQHAYRLYEASGFEDGHALEHWLEAERQVTGSSQRPTDKTE